ncbi:hypothetical protein KC362_g84 [Hortaea werneckii]|nr:hypothetical protein KC362_g84 [Hortaea werneckii]
MDQHIVVVDIVSRPGQITPIQVITLSVIDSEIARCTSLPSENVRSCENLCSRCHIRQPSTAFAGCMYVVHGDGFVPVRLQRCNHCGGGLEGTRKTLRFLTPPRWSSASVDSSELKRQRSPTTEAAAVWIRYNLSLLSQGIIDTLRESNTLYPEEIRGHGNSGRIAIHSVNETMSNDCLPRLVEQLNLCL